MRYNLSGKEIKDCTDIKVFMIDLEVSHITDPDTVRCFHSKLPLEEILLFGQAFLLLIVPFRVERYTLQTQFTHQFRSILGRDADSLLGQYCGDFICTKSLAVFIKNRFDMFFHFSPAFVISSHFFSSEDVVIESTTGNTESLAQCMDTVLTIQFGKFL